MSEHGILFTREMRRLVAERIKRKTRRVIVPQPNYIDDIPSDALSGETAIYRTNLWVCSAYSASVPDSIKWRVKRPRYQVGDLLYVKENYFTRKADAEVWCRVTEVRVERVQDISEEEAEAEGIEPEPSHIGNPTNCIGAFAELWDSINAKPKPKKEKGVVTRYISYPWDDIHETREYKGKAWHVCGNPYVFAYTFERIER